MTRLKTTCGDRHVSDRHLTSTTFSISLSFIFKEMYCIPSVSVGQSRHLSVTVMVSQRLPHFGPCPIILSSLLWNRHEKTVIGHSSFVSLYKLMALLVVIHHKWSHKPFYSRMKYHPILLKTNKRYVKELFARKEVNLHYVSIDNYK